MFAFVDKYHFKNYIRKICDGIGLPKDVFDEKFSNVFYNIFEFNTNFTGFLYYLDFDLCKSVSWEIKRLYKGDFHYLLRILSNDYSKLNQELIEMANILNAHPDFNQYNRTAYGIDIKKYRIFYRCASEQNKFIAAYKGHKELSSQFVSFIEAHDSSYGIYFLYDENKNLIYIGKSINLGTRILSSIRERGAYFVSLALTKSKSDMHIYEPYYILSENPTLNTEFQETDNLNIKLKKLKRTDLISIYKE